MALVHMMPEAAELYEIWGSTRDYERLFPLPYVCFFLGYILILLVDRVFAHKYVERFHKKAEENCSNPVCIVEENTMPPNGSDVKVTPAQTKADQKLKEEPKVSTTLSKSTGVVLCLAIGAHSFFEGIAFGL